MMQFSRSGMIAVLLLAMSAFVLAKLDAELIEADTEDVSYCNVPWVAPPYGPLTGANYWQRPRRPIVLMADAGGDLGPIGCIRIAGSMLHTPGTLAEPWKKLWIAYRTQDAIAGQYLAGVFNGSMVVERYGHQIVARQDGHGLCSIDMLDPDLITFREDSYYYHNMIEYLMSLGYVPGETLFGFPYDWRQSVRHAPTLEQLHQLVHKVHSETGMPVDIMSHSMGGLLTKAYVSKYLEDAESVLGTWSAIGTPWRGGGSLAYKAMISGYQLDMTTVPILDWGLSKEAAHAVELNWPSAFELMPDIDHDAWWQLSGLPQPPAISYQILGQSPSTAQTSTEVKALLQSTNAANIYRFMPSTPQVPNPINMLAWTHSDATRDEFVALSTRLDNFRKEHPASKFKVNSIEGSKINTKFSLHFAKPVDSPIALQTREPDYGFVDGDGTVPYASAASDGMGATHYEYVGAADHQRLLRRPEIFHTLRHTFDLGCHLEGTWKVDIYTPSGTILQTSNWSFDSDDALHKIGAQIKRSADYFDTTLPDGTPISGTLDLSCMQFQGTWHTTWRAMGVRILGTECVNATDTKSTAISHGRIAQTCIYGSWSKKTTIICDKNYEEFNGECREILTPEDVDKGHRKFVRNVIILVCSIVAVLIIAAVVTGFAIKKCRSKDTGYRTVNMEDDAGMSLNDDLASDDLF